MLVQWLRRAAAVARKRLRRHLRLDVAPPLSGAENRGLLLDEARRRRTTRLQASVVALPARASRQPQSFARPRLLVLQMAHIGDFILSLRALQKLRDGFPGSEITLVCATWNVDWAQRSGLVDRLVAFGFFSRLDAGWRGPAPDQLARPAPPPLAAYPTPADLRHAADTRPCPYLATPRARAVTR